jgi:hypothetical protein
MDFRSCVVTKIPILPIKQKFVSVSLSRVTVYMDIDAIIFIALSLLVK